MQDKIKENINNPRQLEELYKAHGGEFSKAFLEIYEDIKVHPIAEFWKARLDFEQPSTTDVLHNRKDILILVLTCLATGVLIKLPTLLNFDPEKYYFYQANTGLIVFFGLTLYGFLSNQALNFKHLSITMGVFLVATIYINLLPWNDQSHSINLAYIHLPLMLWCLYGLVFIEFDTQDKLLRMDYIKYNGDLAILGAIILISGGILTGITLSLFEAIDLNIEKFYLEFVVIVGLVSVPIVATYIIKKYPLVSNKIAPIIASIFSPLVLITLTVYLLSILITGKDPYHDREFLIVFNLMLVGVMAIIVFTVTETSTSKKQRFSEITLFVLSIITLVVDLIALSAILYRLEEYGFTPNRTAVLGSNLLIFGNLLLIMLDLYKVVFKNQDIRRVEWTIARYLPIYTAWTVFVVFLLPLIFGYK